MKSITLILLLITVNSHRRGLHGKFCVDGTDCVHELELKLHRLYEVNRRGKSVGNVAQYFEKTDYEWSQPEYLVDEHGKNITTRSIFKAKVLVGKCKKAATFTLTTEFMAETKAIHISIDIRNWPWKRRRRNALVFNAKFRMNTRLERGCSSGYNHEHLTFKMAKKGLLDKKRRRTVKNRIKESKKGVTSITWLFPYFKKSLSM